MCAQRGGPDYEAEAGLLMSSNEANTKHIGSEWKCPFFFLLRDPPPIPYRQETADSCNTQTKNLLGTCSVIIYL